MDRSGCQQRVWLTVTFILEKISDFKETENENTATNKLIINNQQHGNGEK